MRIAYISESVGWSGGAAQLLRMATALREAGENIRLICQPHSELRERALAAGLEVWPLRMRQDYDLPAVARLAVHLKRRPVDVLHAHHSTAHALGAMAGALASVPAYVVTRRVTFRIRKNPFSRLKYQTSRINAYVAVTDVVRDELVRSGIARDKIHVIPSVIDGRLAAPADGAAWRRSMGVPADAWVLGTVSNYASFKGQDVLIDAFARIAQAVPSMHLLVVGRDTEKLAGRTAELGLEGRVTLAGFRTEVPAILAAMNAFVLPSREEAAATALREAMFAGLPCIGSAVGGIPDCLDDGRGGILVPAGDPEALAQAIVRLYGDEGLQRRFAATGKTSAAARFTIAPALRQTQQLYRRLAPHG